MNSKGLGLLKTLLLSTSRVNKVKHSKNKKTKRKAIIALVGMAVLFIMAVAYGALTCVGYAQIGLARFIPDLCASSISLMAFIFTIFKTNGYMFAFKEYDMLMSLPFKEKTIAACKFLYMYINSVIWYVALSLPMLVVYGVYEKPSLFTYIAWIILTFAIPIIPMIGAAFLGFIFAKISTFFKKKNIIQTILTFVFVLFCFSLQYIIEAFAKKDNAKQLIEEAAGSIEGLGKIYWPVKWFSDAVREQSLLDFVCLILVSFVIFEIVFLIVGKNYRQINSALKTHSASKDYTMTRQKKHSIVNSIAFKEFKRMTGSQTYLINGSMGVVLALVLGLASLFIDFDTIIKVITRGAPIDSSIVYPSIPLIVYFLVGMVATTTISPSIEGKNYWIMQSLPIEKKTIYQGKMLFNIYLFTPVAVFSTICLSISAGVTLPQTICFIIEIIALCCFSTVFGCICGMKHIKLEWENELEVVKQGTALVIYMFPNMFACMGLIVLTIIISRSVNSILVSLVITLVALILAGLGYMRVCKLADKIS